MRLDDCFCRMIKTGCEFKNVFIADIDTTSAVCAVNIEYNGTSIFACASQGWLYHLSFRAHNKTIHTVITVISVLRTDSNQANTSK